ncbi:MAG TPA: hypothetical protein VFX49_00665, partial [Chloroflexota bacterium]|nr:hypothetical protein [Chloroflexota bacterium]
LVPSRLHAAVQKGTAWNTVALRCAGTTIALTLNGTQVASVQDSAYGAAGQWWVQVYGISGTDMETHVDDVTLARA